MIWMRYKPHLSKKHPTNSLLRKLIGWVSPPPKWEVSFSGIIFFQVDFSGSFFFGSFWSLSTGKGLGIFWQLQLGSFFRRGRQNRGCVDGDGCYFLIFFSQNRRAVGHNEDEIWNRNKNMLKDVSIGSFPSLPSRHLANYIQVIFGSGSITFGKVSVATNYSDDMESASFTGWWFQPIWKILVKMGIFLK